jgi:hypothetical protein
MPLWDGADRIVSSFSQHFSGQDTERKSPASRQGCFRNQRRNAYFYELCGQFF